jgi:hypothetical protein
MHGADLKAAKYSLGLHGKGNCFCLWCTSGECDRLIPSWDPVDKLKRTITAPKYADGFVTKANAAFASVALRETDGQRDPGTAKEARRAFLLSLVES